MRTNFDKIDDKLSQKGWNEMRNILDQEMPEKRKRRFLPFFFIFLMGIGVGASVLAWNVQNKAHHKQTETTEELIIASRDLPTPKEQAKTNKSSQNVASSLPEQNIEKKQAKADGKPTLEKKNTIVETRNIVIASNEKTAAKSIQKNVPIFSKPTAKIEQEPLSFASKQKVEATKEAATNQAIKTPSNLLQIEQISTKSIALLDAHLTNKPLDESFYTPILEKYVDIDLSQKTNRIPLQLKAGLGHDFSQQSNYSIGALWTPISNNKWFAETGLLYHYFPKAQTLNFSNRDQSVLAGAQFEVADNNSGEEETEVFSGGAPATSAGDTTLMTEASTTRVSVNSFLKENARHSLVLPFQLGYKINKKWQVLGGAQVAYFFPVSNKNALAISNLAAASNFFESDGFELWTNASLRFYPTRKIGFELGYNRSWTRSVSVISDIVSNSFYSVAEPAQSYNHFVDFSVLFRF